MPGRRIVTNIWITVSLLLAGQIVLAGFVATTYAVDLRDHLWFLMTVPLVHAVVGTVLTALRRLFRTEDGIELDYVNLPNVFSMIRLSSAPTVLWLVLLAENHAVTPVLIPITALVFLTDLLDGQISRRTGQVTRIGQYLDSSSDYTLVFVVSIALVNYRLVSMWLFALIVARLVLQWIAQAILLVAQGWKLPFGTSFLGKASIFAIMAFFAVSLLRLVPDLPAWFPVVYRPLEYLTAAIVAVSLAEKMVIFTNDAIGVARGGASSGASPMKRPRSAAPGQGDRSRDS